MDSVSVRVRGFTLIELMIVVAIIAILAAIALPNYRSYVVRGNIVNGTNELSALRAQMEQYYQDARTYSTTGTYTTPCSTTYMSSVSNSISNWAFTCSLAPPASCNGQTPSYTVTATGSGPVVNFIYTIDSNNTQCTSQLGITSWGTAPATRWITSPGG